MPKIIENHKIYGFADHDYKAIKELTIEGKITWFEYRYEKILFHPIKDIRKVVEKKEGLLESDDTSIYTIVMLAMLVGIDTMGGFLCGKVGYNNKDSFKEFVEGYLDPKREYPRKPFKEYDTLPKFLWELFRNGLAHNFTIKQVGFCHAGNYFRKDRKGLYYINVHKLFEDLKQGFENYVSHVRMNKIDKKGRNLKNNFANRFEYVFIKQEQNTN